MPAPPPGPQDPLHGPSETIERILYLTPKVHVYAIPPLSSNKGHQASTWTALPSREIFTARLRILESSNPSSSSAAPIKVSVLLEDPSTGDLFAAAPYASSAAVEAAVDSSRFFAIRVEGEGGRRAVLGLGFEERSEALDFSIALQEARKVLRLDGVGQPGTPLGSLSTTAKGAAGAGAAGARAASGKVQGGAGAKAGAEGGVGLRKKDWSLKEGEMLHVDIGGRKGKVKGEGGGEETGLRKGIEPSNGGGLLSATGPELGLLPPPPSAKEVREEKRGSRDIEADEARKKLEELGFDDGEFGEFQ